MVSKSFTIPSVPRPDPGCVLEKASSTLRSSRAVPHPSTNRALRRLTSEVGRGPVHSTRYGRQRWRMLGNIGHAGDQLTVRTKAKHCTNPARDLLSLNSNFSKSPCKHYAPAQNQYSETRQTTLARNCARHEIRAVNTASDPHWLRTANRKP